VMKALIVAAVLAAGLTDADHDPTRANEAAFRTEASRSMDAMMRAMSALAPGDADADFVAMMTPHHRGAIEMAQSELRYGRNETLRRVAQEIIVEQQQEIVAMRAALAPQPSPTPSAPRLGAPNGSETP
jgi:uncharacterized protein (DUF305 family)